MNSNIFDRILYANRNIQQAIIPSFIKVISGNAFANCKYLNNVYFENNSKLEKIEGLSFFRTAIKYISFPSNLREICKFSFSCNKIKTVIFPPDSKITSFDEDCFEIDKVKSLSIPICLMKYCRFFRNLQLIEFNNTDKVNISDFYHINSSLDLIVFINAENSSNWIYDIKFEEF